MFSFLNNIIRNYMIKLPHQPDYDLTSDTHHTRSCNLRLGNTTNSCPSHRHLHQLTFFNFFSSTAAHAIVNNHFKTQHMYARIQSFHLVLFFVLHNLFIFFLNENLLQSNFVYFPCENQKKND